MAITGANMVIRALSDLGVDIIFGYPGGAVLPIYDSIFKQNQIKHILVRHEQAAVHMAEGYARSTGKVGIVLVTSGPGATNAVTGLTDAMMDSIPIVCLTGQVPTHLIGNDAFQEADTVGITRSCTKHNYLVKDVSEIAPVLFQAYYLASRGRPGPVVVDLPKDIQNQEGVYSKPKLLGHPTYKPNIRPPLSKIEDALQLIITSKKPIIYAGGGIINSGPKASKLLKEFVNLTGFPITNTLMGLGSIPASSSKFLGMLGMHGTYEANMSMYECDLMINIGARFDDRVTGNIAKFSPNSKKIHVDIDPSSINKNVVVDLDIVCDASAFLTSIVNKLKNNENFLKNKNIDSWWNKINKWRKKNSLSFKNSDTIIKPQHAVKRLNHIISGKDYYITTEVGQHQMWAAQHLSFEKPNRWMTSGGLGTMGYGFPAAIGVQIAHPDSLVICVAGEASFLMNMQELSTISQFRLPVKVFILNNEYLGMVRQWQEFFHGGRYAESYSDSLPDFVDLAESFGIKGLRARNPRELDNLLIEMINHEGPVIADVCVDKTENVFPMIPAGCAHNEMKLGEDDSINSSTEEGMSML